MKLYSKKMVLVTACAAATAFFSGCQNNGDPENYTGLLSARGILPPAAPASTAQVIPASVSAPAATTKGADDGFQIAAEENFDIPAPDAPVIDDKKADTAKAQVAPEQPAGTRRLMPVAPANGKLPSATIAGKGDTAKAEAKIPSTGKIYIVKNGDVLSRIAYQHGVKVDEIKALNPRLKASDTVMVGQKLKMPAHATGNDLQAPGTAKAGKAPAAKQSKRPAKEIPTDGLYTIVSGDTLGAIAHQYGVKVSDLRSWNNQYSDKLHIGQVIKLRSDAVLPQKAEKKSSVAPAAKKEDAPVQETVTEPASQTDTAILPDTTPASVEVVPAATIPAAAPAAAPAPEIVPTESAAPAGTGRLDHQVMPGNTLEDLAKLYFTTVEEILKSNPNIKSNADLKPGMKVIIYYKE